MTALTVYVYILWFHFFLFVIFLNQLVFFKPDNFFKTSLIFVYRFYGYPKIAFYFKYFGGLVEKLVNSFLIKNYSTRKNPPPKI